MRVVVNPIYRGWCIKELLVLYFYIKPITGLGYAVYWGSF